MVKDDISSKGGLASTARSVSSDTSVGADHSVATAPVQFASTAIGMGWQLAVVVLLPIFGGYKLDMMQGSSPLWTLVGLVVAMVGSIIVFRRTLASFGNFNPAPPLTVTKDAPVSTDATSGDTATKEHTA
ncbi:MAG TPA: AtpZ/AtpI family protein [Candidatus Saccharimonadales bacterium]|jgi:F0F1-type ATP synthase assembly protein I